MRIPLSRSITACRLRVEEHVAVVDARHRGPHHGRVGEGGVRLPVKLVDFVARGKRDVKRPIAERRDAQRALNQVVDFLVDYYRVQPRGAVDSG